MLWYIKKLNIIFYINYYYSYKKDQKGTPKHANRSVVM